jgi:hypothetical protein
MPPRRPRNHRTEDASEASRITLDRVDRIGDDVLQSRTADATAHCAPAHLHAESLENVHAAIRFLFAHANRLLQ